MKESRKDASPQDYVWAVEALARRVPWRTVCIQKGVAVQRLLRMHGWNAVLHYGARNPGGASDLEAHVWVSVDDAIVIGGEEAGGFVEIARYPLRGRGIHARL